MLLADLDEENSINKMDLELALGVAQIENDKAVILKKIRFFINKCG